MTIEDYSNNLHRLPGPPSPVRKPEACKNTEKAPNTAEIPPSPVYDSIEAPIPDKAFSSIDDRHHAQNRKDIDNRKIINNKRNNEGRLDIVSRPEMFNHNISVNGPYIESRQNPESRLKISNRSDIDNRKNIDNPERNKNRSHTDRRLENFNRQKKDNRTSTENCNKIDNRHQTNYRCDIDNRLNKDIGRDIDSRTSILGKLCDDFRNDSPYLYRETSHVSPPLAQYSQSTETFEQRQNNLVTHSDHLETEIRHKTSQIVAEPEEVDLVKNVQNLTPVNLKDRPPRIRDNMYSEWAPEHSIRSVSPGEIEEVSCEPLVPVINEVLSSDNELPEVSDDANEFLIIKKETEKIDLAENENPFYLVNIKTEKEVDEPEIPAYELTVTGALLLKKSKETWENDPSSPENLPSNQSSEENLQRFPASSEKAYQCKEVVTQKTKNVDLLIENIRQRTANEFSSDVENGKFKLNIIKKALNEITSI